MSESSRQSELDVVGIGNAIVDVLAHAEDSTLTQQGLAKGTMTLVDADQAKRLYAIVSDAVECSGGSAANTMVGLARLGSRAGYIGKTGDDDLGTVFADDIRAAGVNFKTARSTEGDATGRCLVLVSPDAQRTMLTFLGASATLAPVDVDASMIESARVTYLEGYLWDPPPAKEAFLKAARLAHAAGREVALSLSDPFCVDRHRKEFVDLVENHVDILFANEDEIVSLYEASGFDDAVARLRGRCHWAALTRGAAGAVVIRDDEVVEVPAERAEQLVDTTGAGDLFAAGFLHGLARDADAATCGRMGAIAAAEVIASFGARPKRDLKALLEELL